MPGGFVAVLACQPVSSSRSGLISIPVTAANLAPFLDRGSSATLCPGPASASAMAGQLVGHFKNWKIFHTDYRRTYSTYHDAFGV